MMMSTENCPPCPDRVSAWAVAAGRSHFAALLILGLQLAACGQPPGDPVENPQPALSPDEIATRVVADFLSLPASETTLVSMEAKEFGDSSLDCPETGMSYAQVITPGHRIVVEADGRRFDVRVSGSSGRICRKPRDNGRPRKPTAPPPEQTGPITS